MPKVGSKKNFGYGNKLIFAGKNAIQDYYGPGKYGTKVAHINRWIVFCNFMKMQGITDTSDICTQTLSEYAVYLKRQVDTDQMAVSYAVNLISTVNVVMCALRSDHAVKIKPKDHIGSRIRIRTAEPKGLEVDPFQRAMDDLRAKGMFREAVVIELCRYLGLRIKEACLIDAIEALNQAKRTGSVNITKGTKGGRGRSVDRWVAADSNAMQPLTRATELQNQWRSLVPENLTLKQFFHKIRKAWTSVRGIYGLGKIHDLRGAYACNLYHQITGQLAPALQGKRTASSQADNEARDVIGHRLGHSRRSIAGAYVGTRRSK